VVVTLVDAASLVRELAASRGPTDPAVRAAPTLLDVRWVLNDPHAGRSAYAAGHIPGAAFLDLDADLAGPPGAGGRHPLPDPAALQDALRRAGVRVDRPVVVYDAGGTPPTGAAARAWWTLRWAGLTDVRVLDGGYAAWLAAGRAVETDAAKPALGDVTVRPGAVPVLDAAGAAALAAEGLLLDARVAPRFRGETEPVDPVAGHIPGAVNLPAAQTVDADGCLLPTAELRQRFAAAGVGNDGPVGAYCGSGVGAAQTVLALTVAGYAPALYVGSWSNWITDPDRPVATGEA
jgi:thiosulfate/3-mercaptopyruvate sulfurtransferase